MANISPVGVLTIWILVVCPFISSTEYNETELQDYLETTFEENASHMNNLLQLAYYATEADVGNPVKIAERDKRVAESAKFDKDQWTEYFRDANWSSFNDSSVKRQVMVLSILGTAVLNDGDFKKLNDHTSAMMDIYSIAKICPYTKQDCNVTTEGLSLEPDITDLMTESRDYEELTYIWSAWRNATGKLIRDDFAIYVNISNEAAQLNGYEDMGDMWRSDYDSDTFIDDMDDLWEQLQPLYLELFTYVRRKLVEFYGDKLEVGEDGLLPAHVFGNMWAQRWTSLYDIVAPFPNASAFNTTKALIDQKYTILDMFQTADNFYQSMGLLESSMAYNESLGAMIRKPTDRDVVCHASAWDFSDGKDFRIKMCTSITAEDFETIHHEMGHIQYYMQYSNQPYAFRNGANPGFHEAIGDTIALSVSTPTHLQKIGLITDYVDSEEDSMNALMKIALDKVAFLPFGLLIDKWRWDIFNGSVPESEWNAHWWNLREEIQMVKAPVQRSENDFDPGSKYHVAASSEYIAYFVAIVLQFQFHKSLCIEANQYDPEDENITMPLHKCDIYQSEAAGNLLASGLELGSSEHWRDVLYIMTGERELNASALLEYFRPLQLFLEEANAVENGTIPGTNTSTTETKSITVPIVISCGIVCMLFAFVVAYFVMKKRKSSKFQISKDDVNLKKC